MKHRAVFVAAFVLFLSNGALCEQDQRISKSFPLDGVERVVLRASAAERANVVGRAGETVTVTGVPSGGTKGYHSPDPNWKETPAAEWGLDFVAKRHGSTLVISTKNEIGYIHHHYAIRDIAIEIPPRVKLLREVRELTGDGAANLEPPEIGR